MQYAYTQKYIEHEKTKEKFAFFFQFQKIWGYCFHYKERKSNSDLIARKHAYSMRLENLNS
jgi:hypothetical protein